MFKQVYVSEKLHGSSAHLSYNAEKMSSPEAPLGFFSGGAKYESFVEIFNKEELLAKFKALDIPYPIIVFGEAYGGKLQGMSQTYGKQLRFCAFDIKIGETWLNVENAAQVAAKLGLDFVDFALIDNTQENLDKYRDMPSRQAVKNGILEPKPAEGIVIRPPIELRMSNGERLMAKYKRADFSERESKKDTMPPNPDEVKLKLDAEQTALEWVTATRLQHVTDKLAGVLGRPPVASDDIGAVIKAMVEDVLREGEGEVEDTKSVRKAIGARAAKLFSK